MYNQHRDTPLGGSNLPAPIRVSSIKLAINEIVFVYVYSVNVKLIMSHHLSNVSTTL